MQNLLFDLYLQIIFPFGSAIYLSDHAVPLAVDVLSVPAVGHQVKVVGETHYFRQSLQDVDAEAFAAVLEGSASLHHQTETTTWEGKRQLQLEVIYYCVIHFSYT